MRNRKIVLLFLALFLPLLIYFFLKQFGRNEFAVEPLYMAEPPVALSDDCPPVSIPYYLPDSVLKNISIGNDSLILLWFDELSDASENQVQRVREKFANDPIRVQRYIAEDSKRAKTCVFFLKASYDMALVDSRGRIRGNYLSTDRADVDRLITEVSIILGKY